MKNKKIQAILISLFILAGLTMAGQVLAVSYVLQDVPCAQVASKSGEYEIAQNCTPCDFVRIFTNLSNMMIAVSGSIALVMFVLAGVMMISSYVNPKWVNQAKDIIKYTIIGLFLIFAAYTIVGFVIAVFYGGTGDMSVLSGAYSNVTGKSDWGVCSTSK